MQRMVSLVLYIVLALVGTALLIMTVMASVGAHGVFAGKAPMIALAGFALAILASLVAFQPRKNAYSIGFYILHTGILFFLFGSALYALLGYSVQVAPPNVASITADTAELLYANGMEVPNGYYNRIPGKDGEVAELGFNFRVTDFETEYHDPEMTEVKQYRAELGFLEAGEEVLKMLSVNHPLYYGKWKIYLMAVSVEPLYGYEKVQLLFKYDPGEIFSTAGILLTCLGTVVICFCRPKRQ